MVFESSHRVGVYISSLEASTACREWADARHLNRGLTHVLESERSVSRNPFAVLHLPLVCRHTRRSRCPSMSYRDCQESRITCSSTGQSVCGPTDRLHHGSGPTYAEASGGKGVAPIATAGVAHLHQPWQHFTIPPTTSPDLLARRIRGCIMHPT